MINLDTNWIVKYEWFHLLFKLWKFNYENKQCVINIYGLLRVTHLLFNSIHLSELPCLIQFVISIFVLASYGMAVSPFLLMSSIKYHRLPLKAVSFLLQSHTSQYTFFNAIVLFDVRSFLSKNNQQLSLTCQKILIKSSRA